LRKLKKKSYKNNFHDEPFYVSDVLFWRGIYKYAITSFFDHSVDIHWHYEEELQEIDPRVAEKYIISYNKAYKSKLLKQKSKIKTILKKE
jgi:hypothetical protein